MPFPVSKRFENRFHIKVRDREYSRLNITSLLDMFIIVLFFLLKTYTVEGKIPPVSEKLILPKTVSKDVVKNYGIVVYITKERLYCQAKELYSVEDLKKQKSLKIDSLFMMLRENYEITEQFIATHQIDEQNARNIRGILTIVGDGEVPYQIMKRIIYTCYLTGYNNIFLASQEAGSDKITYF